MRSSMSNIHAPGRRAGQPTATVKHPVELHLECDIHKNIEQLVKKFHFNQSFAHKICHRLIRAMYQFCRVQLIDLELGEWKKSRRISNTKSHPRWSSVYLLCYLASLAHILLNVCNQYILDISKWQLKSLRAKCRLSVNDAHNCAQLNVTIGEKLELLRLIGAPNVHMSFVIECILLIAVITTLICYLLPQVYIKHRVCFNHYFIRQLLDYRHELVVCSGRIRTQVDELLESRRNFFRQFWLEASGRKASDVRVEIARASIIEQQLVRMLASNRLLPFNRLPEWVGKWERGLFGLYTFCIPYGIIFNYLIIHALYFSTGMAKQEPYSLSDWLLVMSTAMMLPAINLGTIFHGTWLMATIDLIFVTKKLQRLMGEHTQSHGQRLLKMLDSNEPIDQHDNNQMNCDIMYLIVHYKLLIRDIKTLRGQLGVGYLALMVLLFPSPVLGIIHAPFMEVELGRRFQVYIKYVAPSVLTPVALAHYSSCYLYAKCLKLHKSLGSLLNQMAYVQLQTTQSGRFYDEHLVELLRREASDSARIKDGVAISMAGIPSVYNTIMKVHYYFSLFITVLVVNTTRTTSNGFRLAGGLIQGLP